MNVSYSNKVTDTVKNLREKVYSTDEFKEAFTDCLKSSLKATDTTYTPDKFGGWNVNVTVNDDSSDSTEFVAPITDALYTSIRKVNKSISCENVAANLTNIVATGPKSLVVKL